MIPYSSRRSYANALNTHKIRIIKPTNNAPPWVEEKEKPPYLFIHLMVMMDNDSSVVHSWVMRRRELWLLCQVLIEFPL